jgi:hypothetical protein
VLQIAAPRARTQGRVAARGREVAVGACVPLWTEKDAAVAPGAVWEMLDERFQKAAGAIAGLNGAVARFGAAERARLDRHVARLGLGAVALAPAAPAGAAAALGALARTQAAVDTLAQKDQRRLMGVWVPAAGVGDMWRRARGFMREQGSWWPPVGVLFLFAAAVPVAVLGFELYAHALHTPVGLVVYAVAVLGGLALARLRVRRSNWQNRFQDHRALAEALRVQLFLALAGVPAAVPDHYLRRPAGELGWIRLALQGPAILALALARAVEGPQREVVRQRWFGDQKTYFVGEDGVSGRMKLHGDAFHLSETRVEQCVGLAAGLVVLLCLNQAALWLLECGARDTATCDVLGKVVKEWLLVGAATAPALAAFFVISAEKRAHEGHAHAYRSMGTLFGQALEDTAPCEDGARGDGACDDAAFRAVTLETAREALAENAEWLMEHRRRRIDYTPGG